MKKANKVIHLRAWDNERKRFSIPACLYYDQNNGLTCESVFGTSDDYSIKVNAHNIDLMLCSGLKDKNGKWIYEGDILEFIAVDANNHEFSGKGYVIFEGGMFSVDGYVLSWVIGMDLEVLYIDEAEIIGNVYENPDLIK